MVITDTNHAIPPVRVCTLFNITCGAHVFVFCLRTLFYITCGAHVFVFCERIRMNTFHLRLSEVCHEFNILFSITIGVGWLRLNDRSRRLRTNRMLYICTIRPLGSSMYSVRVTLCIYT